MERLPLVLNSHDLRCDVDQATSTITLTYVPRGQRWAFDVTPDQLGSQVSALERDGAYLGVGNAAMGVTPGLALFSVHVLETAATADEDTTRLVIRKGGLRAE